MYINARESILHDDAELSVLYKILPLPLSGCWISYSLLVKGPCYTTSLCLNEIRVELSAKIFGRNCIIFPPKRVRTRRVPVMQMSDIKLDIIFTNSFVDILKKYESCWQAFLTYIIYIYIYRHSQVARILLLLQLRIYVYSVHQIWLSYRQPLNKICKGNYIKMHICYHSNKMIICSTIALRSASYEICTCLMVGFIVVLMYPCDAFFDSG